jgi:chemotaxis protein histidine kinase CheA
MEGPVYSIARVGHVHLGDLLVSAFFDAEEGYRVAWRDPKFFDLLSVAVTDKDGNDVPMNATGRQALYQAEIAERLEGECKRQIRWEQNQNRLRLEQEREQARQEAEAEQKRRSEANAARLADRAARAALKKSELAEAQRIKAAQAQAERRLFNQQEWQKQEQAREAQRVARQAKIRQEHEAKEAKRRETQEEAARKRILNDLRLEEEWLMRREGETETERAARHEREAAEVARRLRAEAAKKFQPKPRPPEPNAPTPVNQLSFLSAKQRHDLWVIRRDYPELNQFGDMDVAVLLVKTGSRNSTVVTLFNWQREEKYMECARRYASELVPDNGQKHCVYNPFIVNVIRREEIRFEALRYGITSKPEIDPIAEREMLEYGISPTVFIPLEEEEEDEYCRETL